MRSRCSYPLFTMVVGLACTVSSTSLAGAQQTANATQILRASLAALSHNHPTPNDVEVRGTVHVTAGSQDETGTIRVDSNVSGKQRLDRSLPSGEIHEARRTTPAQTGGEFIDVAGKNRAIAFHNLQTPAAWFNPEQLLTLLGAGSRTTEIVPAQTSDGDGVLHVQSYVPAKSHSPSDTLISKLTEIDVWIDTITSLPTQISFVVHPDRNASVNIPIRIAYSDYRESNGHETPFHCQEYVNGSLYEDIVVKSTKTS